MTVLSMEHVLRNRMRLYAEHQCPGDDVECGRRKRWLPSPDTDLEAWWAGCICGGSGLDPRFDALRGEREFLGRIEDYLRIDLGALVDVLTACGFGMRTLVWTDGNVTVQVTRQETDKVVFALTIPEYAESVRDALAKAIVAAVPLS